MTFYDSLVDRIFIIWRKQSHDIARNGDIRPSLDGVFVNADCLRNIVRNEFLSRQRGQNTKQILEFDFVPQSNQLRNIPV